MHTDFEFANTVIQICPPNNGIFTSKSSADLEVNISKTFFLPDLYPQIEN